jgi:F-type H+-transporting ATPase subunit b
MSGLGIRVPDLIFQIIAFILLVWLLNRYAFKPILKVLDDRARQVRESLEAAERARSEVADAEQRSLKELQAARVEAQEIVSRAREQSEQTIAASRDAAREEAEKVKAQFEAQMVSENARARDELRREVADLAILAASRVVRRSLDVEQHRQLIEETLREAVEGQQGRAAD